MTGTNGKTTTTSMLYAMLRAAAGVRRSAATSASRSWTVLDQPVEVLAVELSSFQLHWAPSLRPDAGVVLNVAEDHLDWHGVDGGVRAGQGAGADRAGRCRRAR